MVRITSEVMDAALAASQADHVSTADAPTVLSQIPFAAMLGITVDEVTPERVIAAMSWAADRCTTGGIMHGGALMAFADTIGALCAVVNLPPASSTSTIESKTNFFRAVRGGVVTATCSPLHLGRTTIVVQTNLTDDRGKLVAQVTQTQAVLAARGIDAEAKTPHRA
jgi:1,4-dihydroxy-2-naphthoyl-CoA hydrolase